MKRIILIIFVSLSMVSCFNEKPNSKGNLTINIVGGKTLVAKYVSGPLPTEPNQFSFQATNRAILLAYFNNNSDAYFDIWPSSLDPKDIQINKKYSSLGSWERGQDDFELLIRIDGTKVSYDYCEIVFSKYDLSGKIQGEFKATNKGVAVVNGNFNFDAN